MDIKKRADKDIKEVFGLLDSVDADSLKSDGVTIRSGNRILQLQVVSETPLTVEDEIRNELKQKLHERIKLIREKVNTKITEMSDFVQKIKSEYDRKERELKEQLAKSTPMPNITLSHAKKGLSVIRGNERNGLTWLVQGIYWPKYLDKRPLKKTFSKKLLSNVIYMIDTSGDTILNVSTRKPIGLEYFQHYHQSNPDCWGNWKPTRKWSTPNDIIKCAREAEAVLENINTSSIAKRNPAGLPRRDTVLRHVAKDNGKGDKLGILNQAARRSGISPDIREGDEDVWMSTS